MAGGTGARSIGLADYTVRKELAADYAGTLKKVAQIGYSHIGFRLAAMSPQDKSEPEAATKAAMVRDAGLSIDTVRISMTMPAEQQIEAAAAMGAKTIAYSASPVFFTSGKLGETTREKFDAWLPEFGKLAEQVTTYGLTLAYHNHWWDHKPLDGETPLAILARTFSPRTLAFEIDLGWAYLGGQDPLALVRSLGARVVSMHLKDVDPARGDTMQRQIVAPGEGVMGYDELIPALDRITTAIGYVEVDEPEDGIESARRGYATVTQAREG